MGVSDAESVAVEKSGAIGFGVAAGWQALMRRRHPMRSFFMALIKTQLSGALFQTTVFSQRQIRHV